MASNHILFLLKLTNFIVSSPHSLSIIFGGLLGDVHAERRSFITKHGLKLGNTRFTFKQGSPNVQYLLHNWKLLSEQGYTSTKKPVLKKTIGKNNKVYFNIKFNTYTSSSFNELHDAFYIKGKKRVPDNKYLDLYLTPLALATWIMDDGSKEKKAGLMIHTNSFTYPDVVRLCEFINKKYDLESYPRIRNKEKEQYAIYITKNNLRKVRNIVKKYFTKDMMRKLYDS